MRDNKGDHRGHHDCGHEPCRNNVRKPLNGSAAALGLAHHVYDLFHVYA